MRVRTRILVCLCALAALCVFVPGASADEEPQNYAIQSASASLSDTQAGAHADMTIAFSLARKEGTPYALTRDVPPRLQRIVHGRRHLELLRPVLVRLPEAPRDRAGGAENVIE